MKLLIVEDNAATRRMIIRILKRSFGEALEIHECERGDVSIRRHAECAPDWTLMDINLPGMSGLDATRKILTGNPNARVIVITGMRDPQWRAAALEAGAFGFVEKDHLVGIADHICGG
jgi:DNA-binding NarL/FixJ family response regulator